MAEHVLGGTLRPCHELECRNGFPTCQFSGLTSPMDQTLATRKSPEPAGWKACATRQTSSGSPVLEKPLRVTDVADPRAEKLADRYFGSHLRRKHACQSVGNASIVFAAEFLNLEPEALALLR